MRYLYGDLTEARFQEDMLSLLQRVVATAVDALKLHQQVDVALLSIQEEKNLLTQAVENIDRFRAELEETIQARVAGRPERHVVTQMGNAVTATLVQHAKESKARLQNSVEESIRTTKSQIDRLAQSTLDVMKAFFMTGGFPVQESKLRCRLEEARYTVEADVLDATGIVCTYEIDATHSDFFDAPKRFSDLVPGRHEIPVGTRKKRMKKEPVRETLRIEDTLIAYVADGKEIGEYRIAPRPGSGLENVLVRVKKGPTIAIMVFRVDEGGEQILLPPELFSNGHIELLSRAWQLLHPHVQALYRHRRTLKAVGIDGHDVLEGRLFAETVSRMVSYLAPIVREIDEHSNASGELSLKIEHQDEGKREEFFLRKSKLLERIHELPPAHRSLFDPLGLQEKGGGRVDPDLTVEITDPTLRKHVQAMSVPPPASKPPPTQPATQAPPTQPAMPAPPAPPDTAPPDTAPPDKPAMSPEPAPSREED